MTGFLGAAYPWVKAAHVTFVIFWMAGLLLVPRLTTVLTVVVLLMAGISVLSQKLELQPGLSIALFPKIDTHMRM